MPIYSPSRIVIFAALLAANTVSAQAETEYFEGTYTCKDNETRSFWALNFEDNEAQFGLRRLNDRRKSGFERGSLALDGRNIEIKGTDNDNFHAQGTLSADGTSLDLAWYNCKGKALKRCQPFTLTKQMPRRLNNGTR